MVVKKYQKGGLHNEILSEYFSKIIELLEKIHIETEGISYNLETFSDIIIKTNSNNILFDALLGKLKEKLSKSRTNRTNILEFKKDFYKTIFRSITNFFDYNSFIAKLLNIYIYMLFIKYLISLKQVNRGDSKLLFFSSLIGRSLQNFNINQNLENMRIKSKNIKNAWRLNENHFTKGLLERIKALFIDKYLIRVPILYGNDYVGNLNKKNKKYIINPIGAFILKLYKSNLYYKRRLLHKKRLLQLLEFVIGSNKIPNLKHLDYGTEFCIIKEQNHEKICDQVSDCSRIPNLFRRSLYGNKMTAEIKEENIASDEHILELLDILLNLFLENNNILKTNINQNEVEQPILSERKPKSLSKQRRNFALGAQSRIKLPNNNNE